MVYTDSWPHGDAKAFASLMSQCQTADADAKLVTLTDEMMLIAGRCGAVRTLRLGVDDVGVSPFNRNKKLLSGRDVHTLASNLAKVGFSWQRCGPQRAIAMQENPRTKEIAAATTKLCEDPLIAPMGKAMPLAGSLGCGHLNQSLRLHKHKHHTPIVDLQEHGGTRLDTDRLCADDPQLRKARDDGLVWQMIEYRLQEQYPDLSGFISSALNVENAVARAESWDEQLARTVNAAIASAKDCKGQGPDWEHVQRQVAWSMPPNIADIGSHVDYIRKYGGGVNTNFVFIQELTSYIRSSMPSGRKVSGHFFRKITDVKVLPHELCPRVMNACVMANGICNSKHCKDQVGCLVSISDVQALFNKHKDRTLQIETIMRKARGVARKIGVQCDNELAKLDVDLVLSIMKKTLNDDEVVQTTEKVSETFLAWLGVQDPGGIRTESRGSEPSEQAATIEYTEDGTALDAGRATIVSLGFQVGAVVEPISDDRRVPWEQYHIIHINGDGSVGLRAVEKDGSDISGSELGVTIDEFVNRYSTSTKRNSIDSRPSLCSAALAFNHEFIKAQLLIALQNIGHDSCHDKVFVMKEPVKRVITSVDMAASSECWLVPHTNKMSVLDRGARVDAAATIATVYHRDATGNDIDSRKVQLFPPFASTYQTEFFAMRSGGNAQCANMGMQNKLVTVPHNNGHIVISVPIAVLTKDVSKHVELVVFREAGEKKSKDKRVALSITAPAGKKQR